MGKWPFAETDFTVEDTSSQIPQSHEKLLQTEEFQFQVILVR